MKKIKLLLVSVLLIAGLSCKKNNHIKIPAAQDSFIVEAIKYLEEQIVEDEYESLDLANYHLLKDAGRKTFVARFFEKGNPSVSITVVKSNGVISGNWVRINQKKNKDRAITTEVWHTKAIGENNESEISVINNKVVRISSKINGVESTTTLDYSNGQAVITRHGPPSMANAKFDNETLPEFTVVGYHAQDPTPFYSLYWLTNMDFRFLFSYTTEIQNSYTSGGGGDEYTGQIIEIPVEEITSGPAIDLKKYLECFDNIPNAGAEYSMTLYADLPDNSDPNTLLVDAAPGHAFVSFTKTNGAASVTQVFGFYPTSGPLSILSYAIKSKIVDDQYHEYDASLTLSDLPAADFNAAQSLALSYANSLRYDLNDFNCTNYALDVFNKAQPTGSLLEVPDWIDDVFNLNYGSTPNGLYFAITSLNPSSQPHNLQIQTGTTNAPASKGKCN